MARFARDCLLAVPPLLSKLEVELGPQTSELGRISYTDEGVLSATVATIVLADNFLF
jgi:hypothetical protein